MGVTLDSLTCLSLNVHNNLTCEKWADIMPFSTEPAKVLKDRNTGNKNTDRKKTHFRLKINIVFIARLSNPVWESC